MSASGAPASQAPTFQAAPPLSAAASAHLSSGQPSFGHSPLGHQPPGHPPPGIPPPEDDEFDPHLAAFDDEAAPAEPGLSARDLLIKELGASILEEGQNPD
jgi:hypothetical protein